ncbi:MAG: PTS sugar transporter subunit IIA [Candidatus Stahlbacteria bacterium]|jgi:fructose-specific phosphotransferase system IIA component|nr:PTS sugar transporter subunit IIA [candidate division WOR-3 bacterium]TEU00140.1 MAG: PTS sugar transporter subunit IIA [Candidatus Stahlbacteria bacterium]
MIEELLDEDLILILDKIEDKFKLIEIMVDKTLGKGLVVTREPILDKIREREELESTGVVEGIALPHARTEAVKDLLLVIAIVKEGLDFQSLDGKPVNIVFLIVAPEEAKKKYINVLARISRMCRQEEFRTALRESQSPAEILKIIKEYDV